MKLILIRHGETEMTKYRKCIGSTDVSLSEEGLRQAQCLRDRLAKEKLDHIYSSDLKRALTVAQMIADSHNKKVETTAELREIDFGKLENLTFGEVEKLYPDIQKQWIEQSPNLSYPGGEDFRKVEMRVRAFCKKLTRHNKDETIAIVAHSGVLRTLLCQLLGQGRKLWWQVCLDLASLTIVETYESGVAVTLMNDCSHYQKGVC